MPSTWKSHEYSSAAESLASPIFPQSGHLRTSTQQSRAILYMATRSFSFQHGRCHNQFVVEPFYPFERESFLAPGGVAMKERDRSGDLGATSPLQGQSASPSPEQGAALEEAQRLRTAMSTYNYLFSSELKAPD